MNARKLTICGLSILLMLSFFLPWVAVGQEAQGLSPFRLATGVDFPYYSAYPILFLLLLIPAAIAVLSFTRLSSGKLMLIAFAGLLSLTVFNIHFVYGLDHRLHADTAMFYWLAVAINVALIGTLFYAARSEKEVKSVENTDPTYSQTHKLVTVSILLAMAVVVGLFAINIAIGGVNALRISFAGIFNNITAILFGPFFGGAQRALHDVINHFLRPQGAFLWPVTVVAFLRGAGTGWMWLKVRNVRPRVYSVMYTIIFVSILAFGVTNLIIQLAFPESAYIAAITPRENQGLFFSVAYYLASWGLIVSGIIGLVPQFVVYKLTRKTENNLFYDRFIKFLVAVLVPGLFFNSVNSLVIFFAAVSPAAFTRGFVYWWAPRFFEELISSIIIVYVMVLLMQIFEITTKRKIIHKTREG